MSRIINNTMEEVCDLLFQIESQHLAELDMTEIVYQSLPMEQIKKLAQKINLLPFEFSNMLFLRYCFESSFFEIDETLEIKNSLGKLLYVQRMLSTIIGLNNSWIDNESIKKACQLAITESMKSYDSITYEMIHIK